MTFWMLANCVRDGRSVPILFIHFNFLDRSNSHWLSIYLPGFIKTETEYKKFPFLKGIKKLFSYEWFSAVVFPQGKKDISFLRLKHLSANEMRIKTQWWIQVIFLIHHWTISQYNSSSITRIHHYSLFTIIINQAIMNRSPTLHPVIKQIFLELEKMR